MSAFAGKVAWVTGAASGIGLATACAFARAGAAVVVSDLPAAAPERVVQEIAGFGTRMHYEPADVSKAEDVRRAVDGCVSRFGRLDFAVNNAGIAGKPVTWGSLDEADWDQVMAVNLRGVWLCIQHELRHMLRQGSGAIVNVASVYGMVGNPDNVAYSVSKHAVLGLTRCAALGVVQSGIRVNAVCPGYVVTTMLEEYFRQQPAAKTKLEAAHPIGRLASPQEIAAAILWLCSDEASFMVGHALTADGGYTIQ